MIPHVRPIFVFQQYRYARTFLVVFVVRNKFNILIDSRQTSLTISCCAERKCSFDVRLLIQFDNSSWKSIMIPRFLNFTLTTWIFKWATNSRTVWDAFRRKLGLFLCVPSLLCLPSCSSWRWNLLVIYQASSYGFCHYQRVSACLSQSTSRTSLFSFWPVTVEGLAVSVH